MGNSIFHVTSRFKFLLRDAILTNHVASFNPEVEQLLRLEHCDDDDLLETLGELSWPLNISM